MAFCPSVCRRQLLSSYGTELRSHAFSAGPVGRFPEPHEVWLSCLTGMVPFRDRVTLLARPNLGPQTATGNRMLARSREHFAVVDMVSLPPLPPPPLVFESLDHATTTGGNAPNNTNETGGESAARDLSSSPPFFGKAVAVRGAAADGPKALQPALPPPTFLSHVPSQSADGVIWCDGSFADYCCGGPQQLHQEQLQNASASAMLSECARVMRPHGVLCAWGHARPQLAGPATAAAHYKEYCEALDALSPMTAAEASLASAHDDVFFPFSAIRKRFFESEYVLSVPQFIEHARQWPQYRRLMTPQRSHDGVALRLQVAGDPLERLAAALESVLSQYATGRNLRASHGNRQAQLRVVVTHFVVSADSRPVNRGQAYVPLGKKRK